MRVLYRNTRRYDVARTGDALGRVVLIKVPEPQAAPPPPRDR